MEYINTTQVLVTEPGGKIVVGLKKRGRGEGRLLLPGGKVEEGESHLRGALREIGKKPG